MSVRDQLDRQIAIVEAAGLTATCIVLSYADHRRLSYDDLRGPGVGYERAGAYYAFAPSYRGLPIHQPGLAYDAPPVIGVAG